MKKVLLFMFICIYLFSLQGCDPFRYPTGVWICEELNLTLDFDDTTGGSYSATDKNGRGVHHGISGRGEILIDGEAFEIISQFLVSGGLRISLPHSNGEYNEDGFRTDWLFSGLLERKGKSATAIPTASILPVKTANRKDSAAMIPNIFPSIYSSNISA